jgi:hypothetical protein
MKFLLFQICLKLFPVVIAKYKGKLIDHTCNSCAVHMDIEVISYFNRGYVLSHETR